MVRFVSGPLAVVVGDIARVPVPQCFDNPVPPIQGLTRLAEYCSAMKEFLVSQDLCERTCAPKRLTSTSQEESCLLSLLAQVALSTTEGTLEKEVFDLYQLSIPDQALIIEATGKPPGWFPLVDGYDTLPELSVHASSMPTEVTEFVASHEHIILSGHQLSDLKNLLRLRFESGPGCNVATEADSLLGVEDVPQESFAVGTYTSIPTETFLEELSQEIEVHPISVYWLLKEGIEKESWRSLPEERRVATDRFTGLILQLLGHRWPKQIEANEPIPDWADADGIIPVTDGTSEKMLVDRVRKRISTEFQGGDVAAIEREFAEIMGKPLDQWLEVEFFKHHVKQFKKRPIAWQIQSGKYTHRTKPAFACLVYYHKLDGDLLPKIRTQYVGPLRQRFETELRGIEAVSVDTRSVRQDKRRVELEALIEELKDFETALQQVVVKGFSSKKLETLIAREKTDKWCSVDGIKDPPVNGDAFLRQERSYLPDINDGVRVNIAPLQEAGLLAANVLSDKDLNKAISDRAEWRADERRWCREGKLPQPGWWVAEKERVFQLPQEERQPFATPIEYSIASLLALLHEGKGSVEVYRLAGAYSLLALPDLLVKYAPSELAQEAKQWKKAFREVVKPELLRPTIKELAEKGVIGLRAEKGMSVTTLSDPNIASKIDCWVRADAFMALRAVEAMDRQTLHTVLQNFPEEELQALAQMMA